MTTGRYLESLNEPTPYDHIQNIPNFHCGSDIVPDLLQFPRSQVCDHQPSKYMHNSSIKFAGDIYERLTLN